MAAAFIWNAANAQPLIFDDFTGTAGTLLSNHSPNINATGNPWVDAGTVAPDSPWPAARITITDTAALSTDTGAAIDISAIQPTKFTLTADLNVGNVGNGTDRGVGLGFYSAVSGGTTGHGPDDFLGLLLNNNGTLALVLGVPNVGVNVIASNAYKTGWTFDASAFHTVSMTIDTTLGSISNVTMTDANGTQSYSFTTSLFTVAQTKYAGITVTAPGGFQTAYVDNFTFAAVPEPTTNALLGLALGMVVWSLRKKSACT